MGTRARAFLTTIAITGLLVTGGIFTSASAYAVPPSALTLSIQGHKLAKVTVPSNYVYNPKLGSLHDYCTNAPDEFPAPDAPNADFRGPCARHDLCYGSSAKKPTCDAALKKNMYTNCDYYYGTWNPLRYACRAAALVYYAAVIVATHKP